MKKLAVLIPCHNEAASIATVIEKFPRTYLEHNGFKLDLIVIDNDSSDNTATVARHAGARVIHEAAKGKGNAMRKGFASLPDDTDYVVMLDGDDTYSSHEIMRMIEPLHSKFCNVILGSRLGGKMHGGAMPFGNRSFNWFCAHIVRLVYRANITDVLTGYFAWTKQALDELYPHLISDGFAIEMEMITKMARLGHEIYSVPISYHPRGEHAKSNISPLYDGLRILKMFVRNLTWRPRRVVGQLKEDGA
jgi:glycosyltransferase involved in cell wall biosynthesis